MSQTKFIDFPHGTVVRTEDDGGNGQGCGQSKRLYVGRAGSAGTRRNYDSYLQAALGSAWSGVGKIVSAHLLLYTDDFLGIMGQPKTTDQPKVLLRRLKDAFTEGDNADGSFGSTDYTVAVGTTSDQVYFYPTKEPGGLTRVNITAMMEDLAPSTVKRRDGTRGGGATNHGFGLFGTAETTQNWSGWSEQAVNAAVRPQIELVYELGPTVPNTPTNLSPSGTVPSIGAFEGDFSDPRATDKLAKTEVELYNGSATNDGQEVVGASIGTTYPANHIHITERESAHYWPDGQYDNAAWEDCTMVAGVEFARVCHDPSIAATHGEAELLRDKAGVPPTGGTSIADVLLGFSRRYAWTGLNTLSNFADLWANLNPGRAAVVQGDFGDFASDHRLRRWQWGYNGGHAVFVARMSSSERVWWCDPLAPKDGTYKGEWVSKAELQTFFDGFPGAQAITANMKKQSAGLIWEATQAASNSEALNARSHLVPSDLKLKTLTPYKWRMRQCDNEGKWSLFTNLVSVTFTNTDPLPPSLTPADKTFATLNGVIFAGGPFVDLDEDALMAYQVQMSTLPTTDPSFDAPGYLVWDTGKHFVEYGAANWQTPYGGADLAAGTYYIRARQWDERDGMSSWATTTLVLTADFDVEPGNQTTVQLRHQAPWRLVFRGMSSNGKRGPGPLKAIIEDAKKVGASLMYNSPGELHFTLPVDHPQISVLEPWQTHYSLQFYTGDGWRETYAGLLWDFDATETDVIFYGMDYLALLDLVSDERYDPANPDKSYSNGGSKYSNKTIRTIVIDQLQRAIDLEDSPVGFLSLGSIATMNEEATIWSTMEPTLQFVAGLLDSHRQGTGKKTRIKVVRDTGGTYKVVIEDDPGVDRNALRMNYGELVQGYRVIPFGEGWGTVAHLVGRTREGIRVFYKTANAPGVDKAVWGRIAKVHLLEGVADENDVLRRAKQAAKAGSKVGNRMALGIRSGILRPLDGYNICDSVPVAINHGAVNTDAYGSGYWTIFGVAWEMDDNGATNTILTILPRQDSEAPDPDLIPSRPLSPQPEWSIGYTFPDPLQGSSKWHLDLTSKRVYQWDGEQWVLFSEDPMPHGTYINPENPLEVTRIDGTGIWTSHDGGVTWTQVAGPTGAIGDGITTGNLPGGSNLIPDGSFEMAAFPAAAPGTQTVDTDTDYASNVTLSGTVVSGTGTAAVLQLDSAS